MSVQAKYLWNRKDLKHVQILRFNPFDGSYILEDNIKVQFNNYVLNSNFEIKRETFAILDVTYSEDTVFTSESGGALRAISTIDGEERWRTYFEDNHFLTLKVLPDVLSNKVVVQE